jgi:hypothetical protein
VGLHETRRVLSASPPISPIATIASVPVVVERLGAAGEVPVPMIRSRDAEASAWPIPSAVSCATPPQ